MPKKMAKSKRNKLSQTQVPLQKDNYFHLGPAALTTGSHCLVVECHGASGDVRCGFSKDFRELEVVDLVYIA